jgi:hypothetical protein
MKSVQQLCTLHCTALHCTALHCTALHCTAVLQSALQLAATRCFSLPDKCHQGFFEQLFKRRLQIEQISGNGSGWVESWCAVLRAARAHKGSHESPGPPCSAGQQERPTFGSAQPRPDVARQIRLLSGALAALAGD